MRIDSHQHFWIFDKERDSWINDEMQVIQRNFMPTDLAPLLRESDIDGVVAVQASQSDEETQFLIDLSTVYAMIKGIVGWIDLQADDIEEKLKRYKDVKVVKGFRHIVEGEKDPDFLIQSAFLNGLEKLTENGYTYDLLIRPRHYASTLACVKANPDQVFILDHMAKPSIKTKEFDEWAVFISQLSSFTNVNCKISGLVTEADWDSWKKEDYVMYVDHVLASFGIDRVMYGSDWPVCLLASSYDEWVNLIESLTEQLSVDEKKAFFGGNAARIYKL